MKKIPVSLILFLSIFILLRHFHPYGVLLYQGVALGMMISLAQWVIDRFKGENAPLHYSKDALLTFLLIYSFVFTIPTTVDRSYTVQMITHLAKAKDGLSKEEIETMYIHYFTHNGGVEKRLSEQKITGTVIISKGKYKLTTFGNWLNSAFRITSMTFACQKG